MKKKLVAIISAFLLIIICVLLWQFRTSDNDMLEVMCKSSANTALARFKEYEIHQEESDYIAGVAEFRTYMTAYLLLQEESNADYIWCNILYGDMILHSENVKAHISELVAALEYLAEDYDDPNGFNFINMLNNQLKAE